MASPPKAPVKTLRSAGPIIILILIVAAAFLGYYQIIYYPTIAPTTSTSTSTVGPLEKNVTVTIPSGAQDPSTPTSKTYLPNVITVFIGYNATVIWYNNDTGALHTVTARPNSPDPKFNQWGPTSAPYNNVNPGSYVTFTFTIPGNYTYYCSYHAWMGGQIIVKTAPPGLVSSTTSVTTTKSS